jgi:hypothetical protein
MSGGARRRAARGHCFVAVATPVTWQKFDVAA